MAPEDIAGQDGQAAGEAPAAPPGRALDLRTGLLILVGVIVLGWALRAMTTVMVPLVASILTALAVMPVRDWVRARVPAKLGWLGIVAAMTLILLVIALFFGGIWLAAQRLVAELPARPGEIVESLQQGTGNQDGAPSLAEGAEAGAAQATGGESPAEDASDRAAGGEGAAAEAPQAGGGDAGPAVDPARVGQESGQGGAGGLGGSMDGLLQILGDRAAGAASGVAVTILNSALSIVAGLVVIFFLTLLLLLESGDWRRKVATIASRRTEWRLSESADVIAEKVRAYLLTQSLLGATSATLYFAWLTIWGVDLKIVWVLLIFLMNFIPNIGSLVGGTLPVVYTFLTMGLGPALGVGAGILVIEQVMGNLVGPRLQSRNIALSPLVILVALLVWGWIWGIAGALLAVPVTTALVVLGAHVPALRPWALLLTDKTTMRGLDEVTRPE